MEIPTCYDAKKARVRVRTVKRGLNNAITLLTACHIKFQQGQSGKGDTIGKYGWIGIVITHPLLNQ